VLRRSVEITPEQRAGQRERKIQCRPRIRGVKSAGEGVRLFLGHWHARQTRYGGGLALVDRAAREMRLNPAALRRRNFVPNDAYPY